MRLKSVLTNGVIALLAFAMTIELVNIVRASQCRYFCDDQIEWVKIQYNPPGGTPVNQCLKFEDRYQGWLYTDDIKDDSTTTPGTTPWKAYSTTSCTPNCTPAYRPYKASGSPIGEVLREGTYPNHTCSMKTS